jgi:hypothetical protein
MFDQHSHAPEGLAKTEPVWCSSCGHPNESDRCTTVALSMAHTFPAKCLVLAALECAHCGSVSFFSPAVIERARRTGQTQSNVGGNHRN